MIFACSINLSEKPTTVIVSGTSSSEFNNFLNFLKTSNILYQTNIRIPSLEDMFYHEIFGTSKKEILVVEHKNIDDQLSFLKEYGVDLINESNIRQYQDDMEQYKEYFETDRTSDNRTIGEIYNITDEETNLGKSEEQIFQEKLSKDLYDKAVAEGKLSDPFIDNRKKVHISDVRKENESTINATAIKYGDPKVNREDERKKKLFDLATSMTKSESEEISRAMIFGTFSREDYLKKLEEFHLNRIISKKKEAVHEINANEVYLPEDLDSSLIEDRKKLFTTYGVTTNPKDYGFVLFESVSDKKVVSVFPLKAIQQKAWLEIEISKIFNLDLEDKTNGSFEFEDKTFEEMYEKMTSMGFSYYEPAFDLLKVYIKNPYDCSL